MSEEKNCSNCGWSSSNNPTGEPCKDYINISYGYCSCNGYCYWTPAKGYPKEATFMEAIEWMEKGNKAKSPTGISDIYLCRNGFFRYKEQGDPLTFHIDSIRGAWILSPPEEIEEPEKEVKINKKYLIDEIAKIINEIL